MKSKEYIYDKKKLMIINSNLVISYIKMPPALMVLGVMYMAYAIFYIMYCILDGYWQGLFKKLTQVIHAKYFYIIISLIAILLVILFLDKPISHLCKDFYNQDFYTLVDFICSMAEGWFIGGLLITMSLIYQLFKLKHYEILCKISLMSALYAGISNAVLKFIFNRERPSIGLEPWHFFHFFVSKNSEIDNLFYAYNSMPSGHTITVAAVLTPLFLKCNNPLLRLMLVISLVLVGFSRVYTINHWLSDILVSTLLGILIGMSCYKTNAYRFHQ